MLNEAGKARGKLDVLRGLHKGTVGAAALRSIICEYLPQAVGQLLLDVILCAMSGAAPSAPT